MIYEKYLKQALKETYWLGILDLDEFLYSPSEINLKNILKKYNEYSSITVHWIHFGSNDYIEQPKFLTESFTMREKIKYKNLDLQSYSYKTIIKTSNYISFNVHFSDTFGDKLFLGQESEELLINHYNVQSLNFYLNVKGKRGDVNNYFDTFGYQRNKERFINLDLNEELDERLKNQNNSIF